MALVILQMQVRPASYMRFSTPCYPRIQATEAFSIVSNVCHPRRVSTKTESMDNKGAPNS